MHVILLDKDGTLLNYEKVWGPFARKCVREFADEFDQHDQKEELAHALGLVDGEIQANSVIASGTGEDIQDTFEQFASGGKKWSKRQYEENSEFIYKHMELIDGVKETMRVLQELGYKNIIVTSDSREGTKSFMKKFGLDELVYDIAAGDDSGYKKPDIRVLEPLMERHGFRAEDMVMVGDNTSDTLLGFKEGLYTVGVLSGTSKKEHLEGADIIIDSMNDLIEDGEFILKDR